MAWLLRGIVGVSILLAPSAYSQQISPGEYGQALRLQLRQSYAPTNSQSYHAARKSMFASIDNDNGLVACAYTGVRQRTTGIPDHTVMNTEHTWPQSKFQGANRSQQLKSDLHHLYPTLSRVNAERANNPFSEIPDIQADDWWISAQPQQQIPSSNVHAYSESGRGVFEPREDHKGNVARSLFYFFTMYEERGINHGWFQPQIPVLLAWHQADPVDTAEAVRTQAIKQVQGNANPFVLDASLATRIFQASNEAASNPASLEILRGDRLESVAGFPVPAEEQDPASLAEENQLLRQLVIELELKLARSKSVQSAPEAVNHRRRR